MNDINSNTPEIKLKNLILHVIRERGPINPMAMAATLFVPTEQMGIWLAEWDQQGLIEQVLVPNRGERPPDEIKYRAIVRQKNDHGVNDE